MNNFITRPIETLDELILVLKTIRFNLGSDIQIAIDDKDTGYHLKINTIQQSNRWPKQRLLIGCDDWDLQWEDLYEDGTVKIVEEVDYKTNVARVLVSKLVNDKWITRSSPYHDATYVHYKDVLNREAKRLLNSPYIWRDDE
jgi:hypothetical protein